MADVKKIEPGKIVIKNVSKVDQRFIPYKENFATTVPVGASIELTTETVGQCFYYERQAIAGALEIGATVVAASGDSHTKIPTPAKVTLTNTSDKAQMFVPYRENFQQEIPVGGAYEFEVKTAGQALYYASQASDGIDVDVAEVSGS